MSTNQIILTDQGDNYVNVWSHVAQDLYNHYGETLYNSWFSKVNFIESSLNTVILCAPTNFIRDWIKSKYSMVILQLFQHYNNTI
ncbi:MAG: chromosomal replication initiator protein DnaA, partial [Rickettsia endosymbiont of Ixodes persulcatus]|nr:chromosomal replication initiator protein DnaA [Rickettsia endosymbiont of Ixodes persulcatus]